MSDHRLFLPEADFEFLHLLKSAQLARKKPDQLPIEVVIGGRPETIDDISGFSDSMIIKLRVAV